jgi:putative two-component system response regulator
MSEEDCDTLFHATPMHDVGKLGIPDRVLLKPGKLDADEWAIMKQHTVIGAQMLSNSQSPILQMAELIALTHHEKWDGSGYPNGLKGEDIPIEGRIVAICDVFDAFTSERPYKKKWPVEKAIQEVKNNSGIHFDPVLVNKFLEILPKVLKEMESFRNDSSAEGQGSVLQAQLPPLAS